MQEKIYKQTLHLCTLTNLDIISSAQYFAFYHIPYMFEN